MPIFEANLWRVGIAVTDYLGMYDDVAKFSGVETDVALDATALSNPARYVLRTQLRKLRGAYADSKIGKTSNRDGVLPASVERSLKLLETFPSDSDDHLGKIIHVLTTESESAAMYLSIQERWECSEVASFLKALVGRVIARLPLSVAKELATESSDEGKLRRDFAGILAFARRLFETGQYVDVATVPAWRALRAGTVCMGISVAFDGVIASLRSHGDFERYRTFDFPADWDIPATGPTAIEATAAPAIPQVRPRISLVEQLRSLIQHLGHRISPDGRSQDRLSDNLVESLRSISRAVAQLEGHGSGVGTLLDWPFAVLNNSAFELLTIELLDQVAIAVKQLDLELGLEVILVQEQSYGFNAQTRRFTDSRNGVYDVTPWMISQFPRNAKHVEEVSCDGRFRRIWTEVFDRQTGKLLSISTLGEPFASIALTKATGVASGTEALYTIEESASAKSPAEASHIQELPENALVDIEATNVSVSPSKDMADQEDRSSLARHDGHSVQFRDDSLSSLPVDTASNASIRMYANAFRKYQREAWASRGNRSSKQDGHVRVALLQSINDITYKHPLVETCPSSWPFSSDLKMSIAEFLKSHTTYGPLLNATKRSGAAHLWTGSTREIEVLPSWSEHRRRAVLKRVIDSCVALNVDLIVLPEYSVRPETIIWLKEYIANKGIAILAGTFMEFHKEPVLKHLVAQMTLLWPVPKEVAGLLAASRQKESDNNEEIDDFLKRGAVLEFSRNKKYRSIALEEFFRPPAGTLAPLFRPGDLAQVLAKAIGFKPSGDAMSHLLTQTRLPLKHLLELICSEIFLVSSPANYRHMNDDYRTMRGRFGEGAEEEEVFADVRELAKLLSLTGDGIGPRRSILAVPAATSRSADYWIAGQASFLAAGTTSVFCNSVGSKELVGGSCFIGRGSWKTTTGATGYISNVTPYHGWSKGIFYNSSNDALSDRDQAVVVADIDPYNMLEGKPRAQTMPSPLQLVAYLPVVESVDWARTEENLLRTLSISRSSLPKSAPRKPKISDEAEFWQKVQAARAKPDDESLQALWEKFSDPGALLSRAQTAKENGSMQPTAPLGADGMFSCPAYYDWIDVSLTLTEQEKLPTIAVPPWTEE